MGMARRGAKKNRPTRRQRQAVQELSREFPALSEADLEEVIAADFAVLLAKEQRLREDLLESVREVRELGWTWAKIAGHLGVSPQAGDG
jgi:hypothetical protein